jgi:hypothetical protein
VIGFVIDEMRKMASRGAPIASTWISPRRLTAATRPRTLPRSTWPERTSCMRSVPAAVRDWVSMLVRRRLPPELIAQGSRATFAPAESSTVGVDP